MTHAQHAREAAVYRAERTRIKPVRTFNAAGELLLAWPHRTYVINKEGHLA